MKTLSINPELVRDTTNFTFVPVNTMYVGFFDVLYNCNRIAILNGASSPLQWTAENGSNISYEVIDELEALVVDLIQRSSECVEA